MSLFAYRTFAAVAEHKSFAAAALHLHLTPSAISHSVTKLEETLGLSLFERTRAGARLTADGAALIPYVLAILNADERLNQKSSSIRGLECGRVRIATVDSICINYIPDIISTFREKHENVEITVCQGGYTDILLWLHSGYADLGFVSRSIPCDDLAVEDVFQDRIMCLTSKAYADTHPDKTYITGEDIQGQSIVLQQDGYDAEALAVLKAFNLERICEFAVASDHSIIALVESGQGICFMPKLILSRIIHHAAVYPIQPALYRTAVLASVKGLKLSHAATMLRTHILDYFASADMSALL